jgi:hypothetical protein
MRGDTLVTFLAAKEMRLGVDPLWLLQRRLSDMKRA